ncbi:hypothetical protein H1164_17930 [Thermoactinomyces daqus]|uniref:Uncharacterized protein n=1 Tax=Thermoactinomyces daqus TaxID=1329516 RepID=A0A7W2AK90_9BACL|nr:hypothetical protein [Thermoactinomyces daqus]MBA4544693.1 hypothetical protein [Thermoactinomyces daqus]
MHIDRISLIYPDVSDEEFAYFKGMLEDSVKVVKKDVPEWKGELIDNYWIGKRKKDYHYNMTLGSDEEGRVIVNWKHNSEPNNSKEIYDMRVEFT